MTLASIDMDGPLGPSADRLAATVAAATTAVTAAVA
jgi:hypothetical protein